MANEPPSVKDEEAAFTGTTQLLERRPAIALRRSASGHSGGAATLHHRDLVRSHPGDCRVAASRFAAPTRAEAGAGGDAAAGARPRRRGPAADGISAWPRRASDAGRGSATGLLRKRSADTFVARRPASRRRSPCQHVGQGAARQRRPLDPALTLLRHAAGDISRRGRSARPECPADDPVACRGDVLLG